MFALQLYSITFVPRKNGCRLNKSNGLPSNQPTSQPSFHPFLRPSNQPLSIFVVVRNFCHHCLALQTVIDVLRCCVCLCHDKQQTKQISTERQQQEEQQQNLVNKSSFRRNPKDILLIFAFKRILFFPISVLRRVLSSVVCQVLDICLSVNLRQ